MSGKHVPEKAENRSDQSIKSPEVNEEFYDLALLGERLRELRKSSGLSLKLVADKVGISIGSLSQIERGKSSPSVRVLASLAQTLQIPLGLLFEEMSAVKSPESKYIVRANARQRLSFWRTGIIKELLSPPDDLRRTEMFMIKLEAGGTTGAQAYTHDGLDAGYVLEGSVAISINGEEYVLEAGDSFKFKSILPHSFRNAGKSVAQVIWLNIHFPEEET